MKKSKTDLPNTWGPKVFKFLLNTKALMIQLNLSLRTPLKYQHLACKYGGHFFFSYSKEPSWYRPSLFRRTEKLHCSEGIDVNLMHSDTPMFNCFSEKLLRMKLNKAELCEKSNRIQIAVSEKNAKTIRKMCVQKQKNVIRNVRGKKSLNGNVAVTLVLTRKPKMARVNIPEVNHRL